ncbi:MAG: (2Fe-2S)-binding protein [Woeseiaceae bacterium]
MMDKKQTLTVNGTRCEIPASWFGRRLLDFLRVKLGLVGSKEGCGEGDCGACTVLVNGEPQCSCLLLTGVTTGQTVTTIEGLPQEYVGRFTSACGAQGGVQCGFCTPGMAVMGYWLANGGTETGAEPVEMLVAGNICRCTGYNQLLETYAELLKCP